MAVLATVASVVVAGVQTATPAGAAATLPRPPGAGPPVPASGMGTQAALDNPRCHVKNPAGNVLLGGYGRFDSTTVAGGPVCVKAWKDGADNGGATASGVTADKVTVVGVLPNDQELSADELQRSVTMGGLALVVDSQRFRGGALSVTMGEIKADLRRAAMVGEEAALDLSLTMGGVELYVPSNWLVVNDVSPFMGVVEDKTEPRPDGTGVQRKLVLRGKITMGAVTITN